MVRLQVHNAEWAIAHWCNNFSHFLPPVGLGNEATPNHYSPVRKRFLLVALPSALR